MDNTFIFFWNPKVSDVTMDFYDSLLNVRGNGCFFWHTHDHQYAKYGDKAFLFIRGEEMDGICASGILTGRCFMDYEDSTPNEKVFNVKMEPWVMIHPAYQPILTLEELQKAFPDFDWLNSPSGSIMNSHQAVESYVEGRG
ncbi:MAG: hypothetical protein IJM43_07010 [Bacteroidaceae bacterium]|nr:hypothetical protein [Bacteroidaceae bacterium]